MDYPSSPNHPRTRSSPTAASTSTIRSPARTPSSIPTIRYFTARADSDQEYESPYAKGEDLPNRSTTSALSRPASRSTGIHSDFIDPYSVQTSGAMSSYSSSSRASSNYSSPGPHQYKIASGMANSSRNASASISAVRPDHPLFPFRLLFFFKIETPLSTSTFVRAGHSGTLSAFRASFTVLATTRRRRCVGTPLSNIGHTHTPSFGVHCLTLQECGGGGCVGDEDESWRVLRWTSERVFE